MLMRSGSVGFGRVSSVVSVVIAGGMCGLSGGKAKGLESFRTMSLHTECQRARRLTSQRVDSIAFGVGSVLAFHSRRHGGTDCMRKRYFMRQCWNIEIMRTHSAGQTSSAHDADATTL